MGSDISVVKASLQLLFGTLMWDDDQTKDTNGFVIFWQLCPCPSQQAMSLAQGI